MCDNKCNRTSDNRYFDCPPKMSDGRHFTDYTHPKLREYDMMHLNNIKDNNTYRSMLLENASQIMALNRNVSSEKNACGPCNAISTYKYIDDVPLKYVPIDMMPLESTLKTNKCVTRADSNRYYPVPSVMDSKNQKIVIKRRANPSGGLPLQGLLD